MALERLRGELLSQLDDQARQVLAFAQNEAAHFDHNWIGPDHLILGALRESRAGRTLTSLGVNRSDMRSALESSFRRGSVSIPASEIDFLPRTIKVIELAIDEARRLGHRRVAPEHLLLGVLREKAGCIAFSTVLDGLGLSLEGIRSQVIKTIPQE